MGEMKPSGGVPEEVDVLVVDDTSGAAEDYASVIMSETGLRVAHTDDTSEALEWVKTANVKVLVLDQKMPVLGTDLYRQVRTFAPDVRAIMLTGEASPQEVSDAYAIGFKDYLAKN